MKPYKILIIEDDPVIQGEMETLLRGNGYTAVSVKDFSKVTNTFKAEEPHLILLDIKGKGHFIGGIIIYTHGINVLDLLIEKPLRQTNLPDSV